MSTRPVDETPVPSPSEPESESRDDDQGSIRATAKPAFADTPDSANPLGAAGGAAAGAAAGAASGIAAGPLGSLAGAVIGGVAGGLVGARHLAGKGGTAASQENVTEAAKDAPSPAPSSPKT